ncbi:nuclear pore complex protein NUP93A [Tanacetum coccineum]
MAHDGDMSSWTNLLHSSSKLVEQAAPSAQFPPLQRNLDQLEALSKKLKSKTLRTEAPSQSIAATRLLAREGINAEQLARDLKSFELKTTFEDVFPAEATSVEEYLQQVHEMAMVSAVQEAQKDNLRNFSDYMMTVLEDDWQKEKRDFLHSMSRISTLPRTNVNNSSFGGSQSGPILSLTSSPHMSSGPSSMEFVPIADKPAIDKKAAAYAEVVKTLNNARMRSSAFKPATAFKVAYESLGLDSSGGKSVTMSKIWHLVQTLMGENSSAQGIVSKKMSLIIGARRHLEWGHEKYIMEMIQSHPAQAALGGVVGNLQRIHAFLRIRLKDYGVLDFDASDARRQPPYDTTWQQIYFCLRTGYYDDARNVASHSRVSHQFASQLAEWITNGGTVSVETASIAAEECEKMLRMGDRAGRGTFDKKKLLLYALISGSRRQIDRLLREHPNLFNTIEDFLWFKLCAVRDSSGGSSSAVLNEGLSPYNLDDLQAYLNKYEPSYYTKNGKDPLVYPYVLLLSIQLVPAVLYLSKDIGDDGYNVDAAHIAIVLADHGVLSDFTGTGHKLGVMDAVAESASIIRQYGSLYLRHNNLSMALEYYAQAAVTVGGGQLSWSGRGTVDQQRQRTLMMQQLLMEILLRDGGILLLLGPSGAGEEGELSRFLMDPKDRHQFLFEAARQCQEAGLNDKVNSLPYKNCGALYPSIEIQKRIGAFAAALDTINKGLSEAICSLSRGRLDGESRTAGLVHSGNELLEAFKYYQNISPQERDHVSEQETLLRQLETILSIHKLARQGQYLDALRKVATLSFLPFDPHAPDATTDMLQNLSPYVQACVPDLLKVSLQCIDNVRDTDGSLRALRTKEEVRSTAILIGCSTPFTYLGVKVGASTSKCSSWEEILDKISSRLSKWKIKTLSIGGRLTLIKSVLTSLPLYHMSIYKVPMGVLNRMESLRRKFFNGVDKNERKISLIGWQKILASKKKGGLGVSSLFALNRALLFKWIWRFMSHGTSLWSRVIKALYGDRESLDNPGYSFRPSLWYNIIREFETLSLKGINLQSHMKKKVGNGIHTLFWEDPWLNDLPLMNVFPRPPRGGIEEVQLGLLVDKLVPVILTNSNDRWIWSLDSACVFSVKSARSFIDDSLLPSAGAPTRWLKIVPIKINILA